MSKRIPFNPQDQAILTKFDARIDSNNEIATVVDVSIEITRPDANQLELVLKFADLEFPILLLRSQTLKTLGLKADES